MSDPRGPPPEDYEDLYENAPCGYLSLATDGRILRANNTFAGWIGIAAPELAGRRFQDLLNIAGRIFYETHFAPLLRMQGVFNEVALDLLHQSGARIPVLVNAAERRDSEGRHLSTRLTVFNATDRRRYERELLAAKTAAETAQRQLQQLHASVQASLLDERATSALREEFIAVLGHDLRNPLAAINGAMYLLRKSPLDARSAEIIAMVERSVARIGGLIEDVMDFARGRLGGGLSLDRNADAPLGPVLQQVVAELETSTPGRVIELTLAIAEPVDCDRRRLGQLLSNLVANALTHGDPAGTVRVHAATDDGWFELWVANQGEPIPELVRERMFQPFARRDVRPSRQGLGLGLYIANEIATAHAGTLDVASTTKETRFTFRMPLTTP